MAHSTGHESRLNRFKNNDYGHEELIAELTAALVASQYGMQKYIAEDSAAYLKSWIKSLKENPNSIMKILSDVKKAANMIINSLNK